MTNLGGYHVHESLPILRTISDHHFPHCASFLESLRMPTTKCVVKSVKTMVILWYYTMVKLVIFYTYSGSFPTLEIDLLWPH